jgi:hypothetical protein
LGRISPAGLLRAADPHFAVATVFNGVVSALLVIFNAAIAVWPMVALNVTLTAINVFYLVRLLRGRHDSGTFAVVEISPNEAYLKHLLHGFDADIQHFNPGFSGDDAAHTDLGFLILIGAEPVGLVLARNAGDGSAWLQPARSPFRASSTSPTYHDPRISRRGSRMIGADPHVVVHPDGKFVLDNDLWLKTKARLPRGGLQTLP